jgi:hypothetical protein
MMLAPDAVLLPLPIKMMLTIPATQNKKASALHGQYQAERTPLSLQTRHWICVKICMDRH